MRSSEKTQSSMEWNRSSKVHVYVGMAKGEGQEAGKEMEGAREIRASIAVELTSGILQWLASRRNLMMPGCEVRGGRWAGMRERLLKMVATCATR